MTENKRFILVDIGFVRDNGKLIGMKDIVERLNILHEKNEQLQKESYGNLDGLNYYQEQNAHLSERLSDLEYQNEMLREELEQCKAVIDNKWSEYLKKKELME